MSRVNSYRESRSFGERLRVAREAIPLSQAGLAELAGTHKTTIARLEQGQSDPRPTSLTSLARALGTSVDWLREGGSEKPPIVAKLGRIPTHGASGGELEERAALAIEALLAAGVGPATGIPAVLQRLRGVVAALQGAIAELEALTGVSGPTAAEVDQTVRDVEQAERVARGGERRRAVE